MSRQLQPSVPLVTLVKTEPPTVTKNEHPEEALEKEINPDMKHVDIVYHSLSEDLIKSETVLENIHETKYSECVETQVLVKTEDTSDENVTRGTDQEVIEVQGSPEHSNTLSNLETHKQLVLNSSNGSTSWEKEKEKKKIKIIRACDIPVESHEYTSLAEDEHICNHCQQTRNNLNNLKFHIKRMHREVTTMYQCPYCSYKSKWSVRLHIIQKHKDPKDIQWFQCNLCEMKFKLKYSLTQHMKVHLTHEQMRDGLDLKRYSCKKCNYKTYKHQSLTKHKITHPKPYFHCYHCSNKYIRKENLKIHIFKHHRNKVVPFHCYICDFVTPERDLIIEHIRKHVKNRSKYDETISKYQLESRINNLEKRFPNNLEDYCSTIHFDDHVNHIKKNRSLSNPDQQNHWSQGPSQCLKTLRKDGHSSAYIAQLNFPKNIY